MKTKFQMFFIGIFLILGSIGCKKQSKDGIIQQSNEVWIQNSVFNSTSLTVPLNTTVIWTNKDVTTHTVTSNNGLFNSGNINDGEVYKHQFTAIGTYTYKCTIHPSMTATIIVQ